MNLAEKCLRQAAMHGAQLRHSRGWRQEYCRWLLTGKGNKALVPRSIRADVRLAGSGRLVLEFASNKVRHTHVEDMIAARMTLLNMASSAFSGHLSR